MSTSKKIATKAKQKLEDVSEAIEEITQCRSVLTITATFEVLPRMKERAEAFIGTFAGSLSIHFVMLWELAIL